MMMTKKLLVCCKLFLQYLRLFFVGGKKVVGCELFWLGDVVVCLFSSRKQTQGLGELNFAILSLRVRWCSAFTRSVNFDK